MTHKTRRLLLAVVASGALANSVNGQSSVHFVMERVAFATGVGTTASQTYQNNVTVGQDSLTGASSTCNSGLRTSLGFWSIAGDLPVPLELSVRHSQADPQDVELMWTGADPLFRVYRDSVPSDVSSPRNLYQETGLCMFTDAFAHPDPVLYYLVLPRP